MLSTFLPFGDLRPTPAPRCDGSPAHRRPESAAPATPGRSWPLLSAVVLVLAATLPAHDVLAAGRGPGETAAAREAVLWGRPTAPTGVAAVGGCNVISLTWNPVAAATSYRVYRSTVSGKQYSLIATVTSPSRQDVPPYAFVRYYYVVTAVNAQGESAKSAQVSAVAWAPVPADVTFAYAEGQTCMLSREDGTGATPVGLSLMAIGTNMTDQTTIGWSRNNKIFYESTAGLVRVNADGSGYELLHTYTSWKTGVSVTRGNPAPDGYHRVFYTAPSLTGTTLYTRTVDGPASETPIDLRANSAFLQYAMGHPSVSPNGQWLLISSAALVAVQLGLDATGHLTVLQEVDLTGFEGLPLLDDWCWKSSFEDFSAWNPNGTLAVFEASPPEGGGTAIYRIDITNPWSLQVLVPVSASRPSNPRVSPDGAYLFYDATNAQGVRKIYRANRDGSSPVEWGSVTSKERSAPLAKPPASVP